MQPLTSVSYALMGLLILGAVVLFALIATLVRFARGGRSRSRSEKSGEAVMLSIALPFALQAVLPVLVMGACAIFTHQRFETLGD